MALADVFEKVAGPDAPVEFVAYDGSRAGAPDAPVRITVRSPVAVSYLAQAPGALGLARAYVSGHLDVEGDMYDALSRMVQAQQVHMDMAERLRLLRDLGGPRLLLPRIPPPPQEVRVNRQVDRRAAALQEAGRDGHLAPLRRVQHVLRMGARPVHGVHLRLLPAPRCVAGGGPGLQARSGWPRKLRPAPGDAAARTWAVAGAAWSGTRPANTVSRRSA